MLNRFIAAYGTAPHHSYKDTNIQQWCSPMRNTAIIAMTSRRELVMTFPILDRLKKYLSW